MLCGWGVLDFRSAVLCCVLASVGVPALAQARAHVHTSNTPPLLHPRHVHTCVKSETGGNMAGARPSRCMHTFTPPHHPLCLFTPV